MGSCRFSGLLAPKCPAALPPVELARAAKGKALYAELCQGCHLPPPDSDAFWKGPWWARIDGKDEQYLETKLIPLADIGTDPLHATTLARRKAERPASLGLSSTGYVAAIGELAGRIIQRWYVSQTPPLSAPERAAGWEPA